MDCSLLRTSYTFCLNIKLILARQFLFLEMVSRNLIQANNCHDTHVLILHTCTHRKASYLIKKLRPWHVNHVILICKLTISYALPNLGLLWQYTLHDSQMTMV